VDIILPFVVGYIVFMFVRAVYRLGTGFLYQQPQLDLHSAPSYRPLVSVIIPAWNEEVGIVRTVQSVLDNGYQNLEIIVVDDGSSDKTAARVRAVIRKHSGLVKLLRQVNSGKASALNAGISAARGSLLLTLDADSFLESGSIRRLVEAMADKRFGVAIGEVVVGNISSWVGLAQHYEYSMGFHVKRAQHIFNSAYIFPGALTMFRRTVLRKLGVFTSYSSTEDLDISIRIKLAGYKIVYVDSALCVTEGATTLRGLLNQRIRWRHGYLECLRNQKEFLYSTKKGRYLTFVDLPLQLLGVLEIALFPYILALLIYLLVSMTSNYAALIMVYCMIPVILLMLGDLRRAQQGLSAWVVTAPLMMIFIEFVEHVALHISIYRAVLGKRTAWTVWKRMGATS
jgi:poly-beta-1,6-N-acetyl-D-glucosamine synthase